MLLTGIRELGLPKGSFETACRGDDRQTFPHWYADPDVRGSRLQVCPARDGTVWVVPKFGRLPPYWSDGEDFRCFDDQSATSLPATHDDAAMVSWLTAQLTTVHTAERGTARGTARGTDVGARILTPAVSALGWRQAARVVRPLGERASQTPASVAAVLIALAAEPVRAGTPNR
jgi:hypothetical protein